MFCWDDYAVCIWFYGFITEMPKGEFVSYFISSWLFFGDQNIVNRIYLCSRFSRRIVQQLQEYGNKDRPDGHMDRSDVMQFKSSSTKIRVPRLLAVRSPSERTDGLS
jgi:hypothetical protein